MNPIRSLEILAVDDNEDDLFMIREMFQHVRPDIVVHTAENGLEALKFLRQCDVGRVLPLVLLDINMPKMNGFETLCAIRGDLALQVVPVVIFTTSRRDEDVQRSYLSGANSYVSKPSSFAEFSKLARAIVEYWSVVARMPMFPMTDDSWVRETRPSASSAQL